MDAMKQQYLNTEKGTVCYWTPEPSGAQASGPSDAQLPWLVFLPGLTADHRLFDKQIEYFDGTTTGKRIVNCLVWDPPSHGASRPFDLDWSLDNLAHILREILEREGVSSPTLVGQSMGGYVSQAYLDLFPDGARAFVSIDSCPLKRRYYKSLELWMLRHTKLMYLSFPWKTLVSLGSKGNGTTPYAQALMKSMMLDYDKQEYCALAAHGLRVLADAVQADRPYDIPCPVLLMAGEEDRAGSAKRFNCDWEEFGGYNVHWIPGAGHNSNCDAPDTVNALIAKFVESLQRAENTSSTKCDLRHWQ